MNESTPKKAHKATIKPGTPKKAPAGVKKPRVDRARANSLPEMRLRLEKHLLKEAEKAVRQYVKDIPVHDIERSQSDKKTLSMMSEHLKHRIVHGWDITDSWCIFDAFIKKMPEILEYLADHAHGAPTNPEDFIYDKKELEKAKEDFDFLFERWQEYIRGIAIEFRLARLDTYRDDNGELTLGSLPEANMLCEEHFNNAMRELSKNAIILWD